MPEAPAWGPGGSALPCLLWPHLFLTLPRLPCGRFIREAERIHLCSIPFGLVSGVIDSFDRRSVSLFTVQFFLPPIVLFGTSFSWGILIYRHSPWDMLTEGCRIPFLGIFQFFLSIRAFSYFLASDLFSMNCLRSCLQVPSSEEGAPLRQSAFNTGRKPTTRLLVHASDEEIPTKFFSINSGLLAVGSGLGVRHLCIILPRDRQNWAAETLNR